MRTKTKAGIAGGIIVAAGLAGAYLSKGCTPGGLGLGTGTGSSTGTEKGGGTSKEGGGLVITISGEQYLIDGKARTLDDVVAAASDASKNPSDQSASPILVKKKGTARYLTVQKLEDELKKRGIRYRSETE